MQGHYGLKLSCEWPRMSNSRKCIAVPSATVPTDGAAKFISGNDAAFWKGDSLENDRIGGQAANGGSTVYDRFLYFVAKKLPDRNVPHCGHGRQRAER